MNKNMIVNNKINFRQAIRKLNQSGQKCLVITDSKSKLLGTLSDGDVRRCLYRNINLNKKIEKFYNKDSIFYYENKFNKKEVYKLMFKKKIDIIPIVNQKKKLINILTLRSLKEKNLLSKDIIKSTGVLIMAGGIGKRMRPFTNVLPKPLLPINNKTAIDHIIDNFVNLGFKKIFISINYKSKILKSYFEEYKPKAKIIFIEEKKPLGTAGSLKYFKTKNYKNLIIINCDIITKFNLVNPIENHFNNKSNFTIFCSSKAFSIPYGSCLIDKNDNLLQLVEKPKYNFFINIGIYILKKNVLKFFPTKKSKLDFNEFVDILMKNNVKINTYPVDDNSWVDVGNWNEFRKLIK